MSLLKFLQARIEILVLNAKIAEGTDGHDQLKLKTMQTEAVQSIQKTCSEVYGAIPASEVAELLAAVAEAPFTEDQRAHLRTVFNNLVGDGPPNKRQQQVQAPELFLTKRQWDSLLDETVQANLAMLAGFWNNLGLHSPTEYAARDIASIAMVHEPDHVITELGVAHVRTFKKLLKNLVDHGLQFQKGPSVYRNPTQMKDSYDSLYRQAYGDEEPANCTSDCAGRLAVMRQKLGCRSSKRGCGNLGPQVQRASPNDSLAKFIMSAISRNCTPP